MRLFFTIVILVSSLSLAWGNEAFIKVDAQQVSELLFNNETAEYDGACLASCQMAFDQCLQEAGEASAPLCFNEAQSCRRFCH